LDSTDGLELVNAKAELVTYRGQRAVGLVPLPGHENSDDGMLAILTGSDFEDGTIEVEVAGAPRPGAPSDARGFVGVLFRVQDHGERAENFYLRPTTGGPRANSAATIRLKTSPRLISPWFRLRKGSPGQYESYVDLSAGPWISTTV
jgi:hypothetical protein